MSRQRLSWGNPLTLRLASKTPQPVLKGTLGVEGGAITAGTVKVGSVAVATATDSVGVRFAGTIDGDTVHVENYNLPEHGEVSIVALDEVTSNLSEDRIAITGTARCGSDTFTFRGILETTDQFRRACLALDDPSWGGQQRVAAHDGSWVVWDD